MVVLVKIKLNKEQTSSTVYPMVLAHQYFTKHEKSIDTKTIQLSYDLIEKGYKRLISFECKDGGFEW